MYFHRYQGVHTISEQLVLINTARYLVNITDLSIKCSIIIIFLCANCRNMCY